jgi:hypothetical protein
MFMAYEPTREWNGFVIVCMVIYKYVFFVLALVVVFIVCTALHVDLAPVDRDSLVSGLGHFWFPLPAQYEAIKLTNGDIDAGNYAVFNLILLSMYPVLLLWTAIYYNKVRKKCELPRIGKKQDILLAALMTMLTILFVLIDYPAEHPGFFGFRVGAHGFYYFRQAFYSLGAIMGPMMLVVLVMRAAVGSSNRKDAR